MLETQAMARRVAQVQEHAQKQEAENGRLLVQLGKLQTAQEELESSFRKLDEENARLSAQLLDASSRRNMSDSNDSSKLTDKQLKKISAKFEKRVSGSYTVLCLVTCSNPSSCCPTRQSIPRVRGS